jgi:hypothetical protein
LAGGRQGGTVQPIGLAIGPEVGCCHSSVLAMTPEARGDVSGAMARFAGIWACSSARLVQSSPLAGWGLVRLHG